MEEQDQPYIMPQQFYGHTSEGSLQFQLDFEPILEELEHNLKGERFIYNKTTKQNEWLIPKGVEKIISEEGVNKILTTLRSRLSKIFVLSDFTEEDIEKIVIGVGQDLIDDFYYNWSKYDFKDTAAASMVLHLVCDVVYATSRKGFKGNYLKFLSTTTSIQEMQHRAIQERSKPEADTSSLNPLAFIMGKKKR